ncbi:Pre-mRNA-splicing factor SYF1 [Halotydeus destructor]|nr:Pre-mRNA-splicing factor SYF1 [Halotydeus destructor]
MSVVINNVLYDKRFFLQSNEDIPFEEECIRNPLSTKHWLRYIDHKESNNAHNDVVYMIFERAIKEMPGSYKLWHRYLSRRVEHLKGKPVNDVAYEEVNNCFERALVFMHKMPRIWLEYCQLLTDQLKVTQTRRTFDRALQALPITQHSRIWPLYIKFIRLHCIPDTGIRVYKRYLKLQPEDAEEYVEYLKENGRYDEAASKLADLVNNERFLSKDGKSKFQLWSELCEMISKNPEKVHSLNVEAIIREGIKRYSDQQGRLWVSLAEYFTRSGLFERSRDIFEEGVSKVMTIRDFSQVFDAYAQSEERLINAKMESAQMDEDDDLELELRLARYEDLIERRPLLLNSVSLRQNPHNVEEWLKRIKLLEGKPLEIIETFTNAVETIDAKQAIGRVSSLWVDFAKFYESNDQLNDARLIFEKATHFAFLKVEDLANVWCQWAEMELRHDQSDKALRLMQKATAGPSKKTSYHDPNETVQNRVFKSLKIWTMFADLEKRFGTLKSTKAVYDRIIDLKIVTPQLIIDYGAYLENNNYFEDAFRAYEKGIDLFKWPNVVEIWNVYLNKFITRYSGSKLERSRDLFEQCLTTCPPKFAKDFYLMYAKLEEEHGLAKHAMAIYDRAASAVQEDEKFDVYNIYVKKAAQLFGVTYTRQIYEKAIESLSDVMATAMCLRFAELERKLGEIDRARAIYGHCSQMCDPRTSVDFWTTWKDFEIKHGNEDTIRELLRIKRSVQATFNTKVNFMSSTMVASSTQEQVGSGDMRALEESAIEEQSNAAVEASLTAAPKDKVMFVRSSTLVTDPHGQQVESSAIVNPDEIDIDEQEDGSDGEDDLAASQSHSTSRAKDVLVEQKEVPRQVFGSLQEQVDEDSN